MVYLLSGSFVRPSMQSTRVLMLCELHWSTNDLRKAGTDSQARFRRVLGPALVLRMCSADRSNQSGNRLGKLWQMSMPSLL